MLIGLISEGFVNFKHINMCQWFSAGSLWYIASSQKLLVLIIYCHVIIYLLHKYRQIFMSLFSIWP